MSYIIPVTVDLKHRTKVNESLAGFQVLKPIRHRPRFRRFAWRGLPAIAELLVILGLTKGSGLNRDNASSHSSGVCILPFMRHLSNQ